MTDGAIIEAVVQVGAQETHYLRCGRGDRVVVVLTGDAAERIRLIRRYAVECRVIAPVPPVLDPAAALPAGDAAPAGAGRTGASPADRAGRWPGRVADGSAHSASSCDVDGGAARDWIRGVIDGLGLERPALVIAADMTWLAERLVELSGEAFDLLTGPTQRSG